MFSLAKKIFGSKNDREIKRIWAVINRVNALESAVASLSDEALAAKTQEFRERLAKGQTLDDIIPEAFAAVREAARRNLGQRHYDVQLIGGIVLHEGRISEMRTGEGKTLTATAPLYLNALAGKGAFLITVNDYLAHRDAEWMGKVYGALGMTTGIIVHGLSDMERKAAYDCDITYGTNNEFGFDYLRDNMKTDQGRMVQRGFHFCIVDEVDSILVDEARTPLIISGPAESATDIYNTVDTAVRGLQKDSDYIVDEKSRTVSLTEDGITKVERRLRIENIYDPAQIEHLHHVQQALKAHIVFKKDVDYVVRDDKVVIVDEHTGRLMPGRRYSDGLHGALEAKERLHVQSETQTLASITFQNLFRMSEKLAGMTGTADTEAVEFKKIYNLDVVVIPTNKTMIRKDAEDVVYRTAREKFNRIADDIAETQGRGQPILVGTVSVEKSELLSQLLTRRNIPHEILNAKNHAREAKIIEQAGQKGRVTISTNMAGRGTDILLGEGVRELGGLRVIGTERHESRRIDNQLRGRSGRQGDPGASQFYLSLEDDLMRIFGSDRLSGIMARLGMEEGEAIISPMVSRAIERAQKRVEEQNFSMRKHVLEYDDVMNQQRQVVYSRRKGILEGKGAVDFIEEVVRGIAQTAVVQMSPEDEPGMLPPLDGLAKKLSGEFNTPVKLEGFPRESGSEPVVDSVTSQVMSAYAGKLVGVPVEIVGKITAFIYLQTLDTFWKDHLHAMDMLRDSVSLRGYGQRDPLQEYKKEGFRLFAQTMERIEEETALALVRMAPPRLVEGAADNLAVEEPDESELSFQHAEVPPAAAIATGILNAAGGMAAAHGNGGAASSGRPGAHDGGGRSAAAAPRAGGGDGMIYHGPRTAEPAAVPAQTYRRNEAKVGRNDPCPCNSGKKYKKCHGRDEFGESASE